MADVVKLSATVSDTNEIIHLGDTIKIRLEIPNVLQGIDSYGNPSNVTINSLQEAWYEIRFTRLDTMPQRTTVFWGNTSNNFTTIGHTNGGGVYTTINSPYI